MRGTIAGHSEFVSLSGARGGGKAQQLETAKLDAQDQPDVARDGQEMHLGMGVCICRLHHAQQQKTYSDRARFAESMALTIPKTDTTSSDQFLPRGSLAHHKIAMEIPGRTILLAGQLEMFQDNSK